MNPSTQRDMVTNALSVGAIFAVIMYFWTRDPVQAGVMGMIMSSTAYVGYWTTNRVVLRIAKRARPLEEPARPAPTTERPEHVQRRRSRRRPRGRQSVHRD